MNITIIQDEHLKPVFSASAPYDKVHELEELSWNMIANIRGFCELTASILSK